MIAWSPAELKKYFQRYEGEIYRVVEDQHFIATRKLVSSDEEQSILEDILDKSKPPFPGHNSRGKLHYLLYTPFRYPPLKEGGRFHTRIEQSLFYGAEELETALSETAYRRFLFMRDSEAIFQPSQLSYTHFVVSVASEKSIFLTQEPFKREREKISHPTSYAYSQALGSAMRQSGAELFTFFSARNDNGINVGIFSTEAFPQNTPVPGKERHWSVFIDELTVEFQRPHIRDNEKESHVFRRRDLLS